MLLMRKDTHFCFNRATLLTIIIASFTRATCGLTVMTARERPYEEAHIRMGHSWDTLLLRRLCRNGYILKYYCPIGQTFRKKRNFAAMKKTIADAVFAGLMIGFGCIVYVLTPDHVIGSFLFSFGLLTVVIQQKKLYTGMVGYTDQWSKIPQLLLVMAVNLAAIWLLCRAFALWSGLDFQVTEMVAKKTGENPLNALIRSIGCGAMMYLAVDGFRKTTKSVVVMMPVMIFILCGFDHCIANYGYMAMAGCLFCWNLPVWIVGNAIGSQIMARLNIPALVNKA